MALGKARLKLYQIEFETTPISIEALCGKYTLTKSDFKGYTKWVKKEHSLSTQTTQALNEKMQKVQEDSLATNSSLEDFGLAPEPEDIAPDLKVAEAVTVVAEDIPAATEATVVPDDIESGNFAPSKFIGDQKTPADLLEDIAKFKESAVQHCLNFMMNDAAMAETKEFKEIVAIIDTLEKSLVPKVPEGPSVQVAIQVVVQNLMQGKSDDC